MKRAFITLVFCAAVLTLSAQESAVAATDHSVPTVDKIRITKQYNKKIQLRWKKIKKSGVRFYQIKTIRQKESGKYKQIKRNKTKKNVKKYLVKKLSPGRTYFFKIRACKTKKKCGPWSDRYQTSTTTPDPVLKNLIIDIEPYNADTNMAGAFDFNASYNDEKVLYEFGAEVADGMGGTKKLPTFEYRTDDEALVYSPVNGTINTLTYQDSTADYEMVIGKYESASVYVSIDHVKNLQVAEGDKVSAGDVIGTAGTWGANVGRVELMLWSERGYECPFNYFDEDLQQEFENKVWQLFEDWETFKYDDTIYDESSMTYAAGCPYETLTDDEL